MRNAKQRVTATLEGLSKFVSVVAQIKALDVKNTPVSISSYELNNPSTTRPGKNGRMHVTLQGAPHPQQIQN